MKKLDFFNNAGGLNLTDSPFTVQDSQATAGYNFDYLRTGAVRKRLGHRELNTVALSPLRTLGQDIFNPVSGDKTQLRATDSVLQTFNTEAFTATTILEDTATVNSTFFVAGSTQAVVFSNFNTPITGLTWMAGGGYANGLLGYNGTVATRNGVVEPSGTFSGVVSGTGQGGVWVSTNYYTYALVLRKNATEALSNAALDFVVNIDNVTKKVTITLPTVDATKYDQFWIYRSAGTTSPVGSSGFTTGDLVAQIPSTDTTFIDLGSFISTAELVPRTGSASLDNSVLPNGTYNVLTTFKRRLVTAEGSTLYLADLDKPESWPAPNRITLPTGGPITAVSVIGFNPQYSGNTDEYLVIFKDTELWVLTGNSSEDWVLKFIDTVGAAAQRLVIASTGFISWLSYRGIFLWSGSGKPVYVSRPIEVMFGYSGDLDKTKLNLGWGRFYRQSNQIIWYMSHRTLGEQKLAIKLDLRLTFPRVDESLDTKVVEGVFTLDSQLPLYAGVVYIPTGQADEAFYAADQSGFIYSLFCAAADPGSVGVDWSYQTKPLDCGALSQSKKFYKVIAWVDDTAAADLSLTYWVDYRVAEQDAKTITQPIREQLRQLGQPGQKINAAALWDIGVWDQSFWDDGAIRPKAIAFNLGAGAEGDALMLQFSNSDPNVPIILHGFSLIYEEASVRH